MLDFPAAIDQLRLMPGDGIKSCFAPAGRSCGVMSVRRRQVGWGHRGCWAAGFRDATDRVGTGFWAMRRITTWRYAAYRHRDAKPPEVAGIKHPSSRTTTFGLPL